MVNVDRASIIDRASYLNDVSLVDGLSVNGNKGRMLVTLTKVRKPQPQVARARNERENESSHCNIEKTRPRAATKVTQLVHKKEFKVQKS